MSKYSNKESKQYVRSIKKRVDRYGRNKFAKLTGIDYAQFSGVFCFARNFSKERWADIECELNRIEGVHLCESCGTKNTECGEVVYDRVNFSTKIDNVIFCKAYIKKV